MEKIFIRRKVPIFTASFVTAVFAFLFSHYLPWWSIAIAAFLVCIYFIYSQGRSFLVGFMGIFSFWMVAAALQSMPGNMLMANKMAEIFFLPSGWLYIFVSALLGGLVGGLAGWSGGLIRGLFYKRQNII